MLDNETLEQLREVFGQLEGKVELVVELSRHGDQGDLLNMLEGIASTSSKIELTKAVSTPGMSSVNPRFHIYHNGKPSGISFTGIPGGHEFTSLVVGILNADRKGKMPDSVLTQRIMRLKGPIRIRTYISLTCENCPDVVQALNQMAILHPQFEHEMVDGGYVPDEIEKLGIQGVPSVVVDGKLIHSGRIGLLELIAKLESTFGTQEIGDAAVQTHLGKFDVVVVGGGPAGVSAAIYSVRKGLKTALIAEKIGGQVQETRGIENLISVVYTEGPQLAEQLAKHLMSYPVQLIEHRRVKAIEEAQGAHLIELDSGEKLDAERIIVATGAKWRELNIPGEREYIGRGVAFCPHCDGPFYKGKKVAVIGGGNSGVEAAIDLAGIVNEVVLIEYAPELKADKILVDKLKAMPNVTIKTNVKTTQIGGNGQKVTKLEFEDRSENQKGEIALDGVFVQIGLIPNSQFLKGVVDLSPFGEVKIDEKCRTSKAGIYAAGDVTTTPFKQIIISMGEGAKAALTAFEDKSFK